MTVRLHMHRKTRDALDLLREDRWGWLTNGSTGRDHRRRKGERLLINHTTAQALVDRGLARFEDANGDDEADKIRLVEPSA